MNFAALSRGESVFLDANTFVFHFQPHPQFGLSCTALLQRIELQEFAGRLWPRRLQYKRMYTIIH
jgi:hypothetical protein